MGGKRAMRRGWGLLGLPISVMCGIRLQSDVLSHLWWGLCSHL